MSVTVKVCGITSEADALAAADAGADAIGLMFYEDSPRYVSIEQAKAISAALPPHIVRVGVFVNAAEAVVSRAIAECTLSIAQFHGDETPEDCGRFAIMTLKAFRMKGPETLEEMERYPTDGFLLDAFVKDELGGTGAQFNWNLAVRAREFGRPIFLAGGLTAENVGQAVQQVQPFAVDVSSGVELEPGKKCADKMRAFVSAAKGALN
ncbi:MAG: phosphoribosylanthranilate isomerase [Verrucomicrobia subdivision 3 bacterium]|nr:phosphoribosylanthranilate isomerase [Limisphaerales bacterium]